MPIKGDPWTFRHKSAIIPLMAHLSMDQAIAKLREENPRYAPAGYHFIRRSLDHSLRKLKRGEADGPAHVSGKELLEGFRDLARILTGCIQQILTKRHQTLQDL